MTMLWYRTLSPGERLRLEFATLIAQELYEHPARLAQTLGRFRENQALQEIGMVLEQGGHVEYGADGNLYLHTNRNPMTYLDKIENPMLVVKEIEERPPTPSEIRRAEQQASAGIENDNIEAHISGLLRPPIINDGVKAVENEAVKAFALFMSANDYLTFVAETEFEPTTRYPLLRRGIQGMHQGMVVCLSRKCGPGQIYVVADNGAVAVINCN